jgi:filamentous hemagglutinin family protein
MKPIAAALSVAAVVCLLPAHAGQVALDGKFGPSGALTGPNYDITAGLGKIKGQNLFQSFADFSLDAGETANIRNILARVTGGHPSSIDGTIRSDITGANLFFLNPAGVIFGPNAALDLTGAFAVSTADYFKLAGGARFGVGLDASADSKLTSRPVAAFGFMDGNPGNITIHGALATVAGKTFSVVGGDIVLDGGQILAPDGRVNLLSAQSAGEVALRSAAGRIEHQGSIELHNFAAVDVSGDGGGEIVIRGGRLVVENASVKADTHGAKDERGISIHLTEALEALGNGQITTDASGSGRGGDIQILAPSVLVDGQDLDATGGGDSPNPTRIAAETSSDLAKATGGDVILKSDSLELRGGGEISTSTRGAARAGRVEIATGSLMLTGSESFFAPPTWIRANASPFLDNAGAGGDIIVRADSVLIAAGALLNADTQGGADAGRIRVTTKSLAMLDGAITTRTAGPGDGGAIDVRADTITMDGIGAFLGAETSGDGKGGDIRVRAGSLLLVNNGLISASSFGDGDGGNISLRVRSLALDTAEIPSGIIASSDGGNGDGGDIQIKTGSLDLQNGMQISTSSSVTGDGGRIAIRARSVTLDTGSSIQSASTGSGVAGGIRLKLKKQLALAGGSFISVSAAENEAGTIEVFADTIAAADSQISADAPQASGGSIELFALRGIELINSSILAAANDHGGNVSLGSPLFLFDPAFRGSMDPATFVSANAVDVGGNITIGQNFSIAAPENITATGAQAGNVEIGAPEIDLSGTLVALPANLLDAESLLRPDCGVRLAGHVSSFVALGRGGLPLAPGGFVPSSLPTDADERR